MNTKLYALLLTLACATGAVHASDGKERKNPQGQPGSAGSNQTEETAFVLVDRGNGRWSLVAADIVSYANRANAQALSEQERVFREQELERMLDRSDVTPMVEALLSGTEESDLSETSSSSTAEGRTSNRNRLEQEPAATPHLLSLSELVLQRGAGSRSSNSSSRRSSTNRSLSRDSDTK